MALGRWTFLGATITASVVIAIGCAPGGGPTGAGGTAGSPTSTSSTTSSTTSSASTSSSTSTGTGGAVGTGGTGGSSVAYVPSGFSCSTSKPSLNIDVVAITQPNCSTMAACHLAMQNGSGVYDQLVNRIAEECDDLRLMVAPGDPEGSYVIHKLTGHNLCSPPTTMPLDSAPLAAAHIQTIYDWICEGAPQN